MRRLHALSLGVALAGCVQVSDFEPVGPAAAIAGSWTIDGAGADEARCKSLLRPFVGPDADPPVPRVRAVFVDEGRAVPHGALVFPCTAGSFDTGGGRVVADGTWTIRLEAIDGAGSVVAAGPDTIYTTVGGRIELDQTPFVSAMISASFTIDGAPPTNAACDALGVSDVVLALDAGMLGREPRERCAVGAVGTRAPPGTYVVRLVARDASGATVRESAPASFTLAAGEHGRLAEVDLGGP